MKTIAILMCAILWESVTYCAPLGYKYGVIMDAGSSGTRVYVYKWQDHYCDELPNMEQIISYKRRPGLSEYSERHAELPEYLGVLIDKAKEAVPENQQASTRINLFATAGFRKFDEFVAEDLLEAVRGVLKNPSHNPFSFADRQVQVLSGEEEGAYAWAATNFLLGNFNADTDPKDTAGIVEMGGASAQIAFVPFGPIFEGLFRIELVDRTYELYSQSYMSYGQDMFGEKIAKTAMHMSRGNTKFDNPCAMRGDERDMTIDGRNVEMRGNGNARGCERIEKYLLHKNRGDSCNPKPCAIGSVYQPHVTKTNFYALSAFYYAPTSLGAVAADGTLDIPHLRESAKQLCGMTLDEASEWTGIESKEYLTQYCQMGVYIPILLTNAYGFPEKAKNIKVVNQIGGSNVDWTLGAMLDEDSLGRDCQERGLPRRTLRVKRK